MRWKNWIAAAAVLAAVGSLSAADWPAFRGPNRDGLSTETGLLKQWPKDGPKQVWTAKNLGLGFGTPSVAEGKIFGIGTRACFVILTIFYASFVQVTGSFLAFQWDNLLVECGVLAALLPRRHSFEFQLAIAPA